MTYKEQLEYFRKAFDGQEDNELSFAAFWLQYVNE